VRDLQSLAAVVQSGLQPEGVVVLPRLVVSPRERRPASCSRPFSLSGQHRGRRVLRSKRSRPSMHQPEHPLFQGVLRANRHRNSDRHSRRQRYAYGERAASQQRHLLRRGISGHGSRPLRRRVVPVLAVQQHRQRLFPSLTRGPREWGRGWHWWRRRGRGWHWWRRRRHGWRRQRSASWWSSAPRWRANLGPWPHRLRCSQPRPGEAARSSQLEYWRHLSGRRERQVHYQDQALCGLRHDCQKDQIKAGAAARQWDRGPAPRDAWPHQDSLHARRQARPPRGTAPECACQGRRSRRRPERLVHDGHIDHGASSPPSLTRAQALSAQPDGRNSTSTCSCSWRSSTLASAVSV